MTRVRWAAFLMGAWVAGSLFVSVIAAENFYTIDRLLSAPANHTFQAMTDQLGRPAARDLLRYLSSELNRLYFQLWNIAQVVIAAAVFVLLRRVPRATRIRRAAMAMLAVVVLMLVWLAPEITAVGRTLDFVPRETPPPQLARFGVLHAAYAALEMVKLLVGVIATAWMARLEP
jgi:hypothetical protein